jgi:LuxR family maltose regulon positive regulatory protein
VPLLVAPGTDVAENVLPALLNDLAELPEPAVLAIDDYHQITRADIQDQVARFVERLPSTLQISLTTRSGPPAPACAMAGAWGVARGRPREPSVRAGGGRRAPERVLELGLSADQVGSLCRRTEG